MEETQLKIEYLKELRSLIESDVFNNAGKLIYIERYNAVCDSVEKDLLITHGSKEKQIPPTSE